MRRLIKQIVRRLLQVAGYSAISASALADLTQSLAEAKGGVSAVQGKLGETHSHVLALRQDLTETKGGVSAIQGYLGETLSHALVLRQELTETKGGVSAIQGQLGETLSHTLVLRQELAETKGDAAAVRGKLEETLSNILVLCQGLAEARASTAPASTLPQQDEWRALPQRLDQAAANCLKTPSGEHNVGLANHYMRLANLVSRHWVLVNSPTQDPHASDDLTIDYAVHTNVFVPGPGNEADVDPAQPSFPWRQLFADPACGVFLVLGQSNAANHGDTTYSPQREVYNLDFLRMRCTRANDPLPGASGSGGSIWSRLGDLLIEKDLFERVLFVPVAFGGAFITDLVPGGSKHGRTVLTLTRLRKELGMLPIPFSAVLWQQGEAEANHTRMTAESYQSHFYDVVSDLRSMGVFAPIFVAHATVCEAGPHPFENHQAIREGQRAVVNAANGIFQGPDVDTIRGDGRFDKCHFSKIGLRRCAELWVESIASYRGLLFKP